MPSTISPTRENLPRGRVVPTEVTIVDWPVRDQPLGASLALVLAAGAVWLAVWATGNAVAGTVVGVLLAVTLWRTWLPVRYQIGSGGVEQKVLGFPRRMAWSSIRHYEVRGDGVVLFFDSELSKLSPLRGVYIRWGSQREAVLANLEFFLPGRSASC
jgi:hypothetical protein